MGMLCVCVCMYVSISNPLSRFNANLPSLGEVICKGKEQLTESKLDNSNWEIPKSLLPTSKDIKGYFTA